MDKILSKDTIKNVFSALGAKTSDSNYGVALLDKTSGEPKGLMGMSDLASVLGGMRYNGVSFSDFNNAKQQGVYKIDTGTANLPTGAYPYGCLVVFNANPFLAQIYIPDTNRFVFVRTLYNGTDFRPWKMISMEELT